MNHLTVPSDTETGPNGKPVARSDWIRAGVCVAILIWINFYICRGLFTGQTAPMNSMHGFWMAIAQRAEGGWFRAEWWPYWDGGIPFEFTYAPLVPMLTALLAAVHHVTLGISFQIITAIAYCGAPVTLFLMAWYLTRKPGYSFLAALFYSLTAPTRILVPDDPFSWHALWDARRLYLLAAWDDTPHVLSLVFLPLTILFLYLSTQKRRAIFYAATAVSIAAGTLASAFGPTMVAMAAVCLLFVLRRENAVRNILITAMVGAYAYALSAVFLSPGLIHAIQVASKRGESGDWSMGSVTALAIVTLGWVVLWRYLPRWTRDWRLQFFTLFAYLTTSVPVIATYLHRQFLPQPNRYKFEMEFALALLVAFGAGRCLERAPRSLKAALLFLALALAGEQIVSYRQFARNLLRPVPLENTVEFRVADWTARNLPGVRIMLPGSISQWADFFAPIYQFAGGPWSMAYNPVQQRGLDAAYGADPRPVEDAHIALAWLKAYGAGAVCVSGPKSPEFWKPYLHPQKFDGVLPVLWQADDTTIYRIPQRTASWAHVIPEAAVIRDEPRKPADLSEIERFNQAVDDPALPPAELEWKGRNRMEVRSTLQAGQVLALQVNYHPGWHATVGGHSVPLRKDGLGLTWLSPGCNGACTVELEYDGGWELRLCRWVSILALLGLVIGLPLVHYRLGW